MQRARAELPSKPLTLTSPQCVCVYLCPCPLHEADQTTTIDPECNDCVGTGPHVDPPCRALVLKMRPTHGRFTHVT